MPVIAGIPEYCKTRDTAGTGGILSIERRISTNCDERYVYTIKGKLLTPLTRRRNYQNSSRYTQINDIGLTDDWELAHLWPPRFGDESAAGIMAAPKELNQKFQNHGVEKWVQQLRLTHANSTIEVTASAACWCNKFLRSKNIPNIGRTEYLKWVKYTISGAPIAAANPADGRLQNTSIMLELTLHQQGGLPRVIVHANDSPLNWM
ncbi:polymorphic toxin type 4 domain-containing protein [Microbulbifer sp. ANSA001]|uniref:polymorphic toxin type 4 domain-containing protein n=1 Tax=Microbulbifer sp. ANSA001 TaxID=3243358 RepID=UPI00404102F7